MAERQPREETLRRVHGPSALFAAAYGNVGSSIYYALGVVALYALGLTPITFMIAGVIFIFTAASYTEATVMYPEAGGSSSFARHAFNEVVSFFAAWGQMLTYIITISISAFFVPHYLAVFWEPLSHGPGDVVGGAILIMLLALLNIKGTQESARLNLVLAIADLFTQVLLVAVGIVLVLNPDLLVNQIQLGTAPSWGNFALGIAVGMVAYTGIETISNMSEEAKKPFGETISRGVGMVVLAVVGLYALLPSIALSAMPVVQRGGEYTTELGTTYKDDPVLGIVENIGLGQGLTSVLRVYVGILAAVILIIATNAALIGVSRLTYSMGHYRQLPERLRAIHPRFKTPYVAILLFSAVAIVTLLPGQTSFLATMYSFGAMLSFTIAHASVIWLRRREPDHERGWKPPGNFRVFGTEVPITAVLGGLGTLAAWIVVMALNPITLIVGGGWIVVGMTVYLLYRRHQGLPLTQTVKVLMPTALGVEEVEYRSVLVAFEDDEPFSAQMVATALKLASPKRRAIHVHSMITVPNHLPLDAELKEEVSEAKSRIEQAKLICGMRVTGHIERVRAGQAGYSLAEEARTIKAAALVVGLRHRNGQPLYGKTLQTVLSERPCRVIVISEPGLEADGDVPTETQARARAGSAPARF